MRLLAASINVLHVLVSGNIPEMFLLLEYLVINEKLREMWLEIHDVKFVILWNLFSSDEDSLRAQKPFCEALVSMP